MLKKFEQILIKKKETLLTFAQEFKDIEHNYKDLSPAFIFGLFLIFISFVIGWGGPAFALWYGFKHKSLVIPALIGTLTYAAGWILTPIGLAITAKKNIYYARYFAAKFILRLYNPLDRPSIMEILSPLLVLLLVVLYLVFKWTTTFRSLLIILFCVHQVLLIISLVVPNTQLLSRTVRGKDIALLASLYPNEQIAHLVDHWTSCSLVFRFDDGVDPEITPYILKILEQEQLKGIFAVTGENAEKYPHLVRRAAEEGHLIVNHSYSHPNLFSLLGKKRLQEEIIKTNQILQKLTGKQIHFFAPPIGHSNLFLRKILCLQKMTALGWDLNSHDVLRLSESKKQHFFKSILSLPKPAIILFHDGVYRPGIKHKEQTLDLLIKTLLYNAPFDSGRVFLNRKQNI